MTPEQVTQTVELTKRSVKLAQDYKARVDGLEAKVPSADEVKKAADHLVACRVIDPASKESAVAALGDHRKALDVVMNLSSELLRAADVDQPGAPIKRAGDRGVETPPAGSAYDYTGDPEYTRMTEDVIKMAAAVADNPS